MLGFEPAEHRRRSASRAAGEAEPVEVALQGAFIGRAQPSWVRRIRRIAAAVRCGSSRRSATASSNASAGVRGVH